MKFDYKKERGINLFVYAVHEFQYIRQRTDGDAEKKNSVQLHY